MSGRRVSLFAIVATLCLLFTVCRGQAQDVSLTIVHVNDLSRAEEIAGRGGIARLAALIARERASGRAGGR